MQGAENNKGRPRPRRNHPKKEPGIKGWAWCPDKAFSTVKEFSTASVSWTACVVRVQRRHKGAHLRDKWGLESSLPSTHYTMCPWGCICPEGTPFPNSHKRPLWASWGPRLTENKTPPGQDQQNVGHQNRAACRRENTCFTTLATVAFNSFEGKNQELLTKFALLYSFFK